MRQNLRYWTLSITSEFTHSDVEILSNTNTYDGFFKMQTLTLKHRLFEGGWSQPIHRELFVRGKAAGVLLYDRDKDSVVLIEQFRIGSLMAEQTHNEKPCSPWLFELVAGIVESGENPEEVAIREAKEESGADIQTLIPICDYLVSPGGTNESLALFCATVDSANIAGIHGLEEEDENIRVHVVSRKEAMSAILDGRINNAATIIALQWLELNKLKQLPALMGVKN